jgi:NTP pyrophosphatase (non-canonical NTP hydrolase)
MARESIIRSVYCSRTSSHLPIGLIPTEIYVTLSELFRPVSKGDYRDMNAADFQEQAARTQIMDPGFQIPGHEIMVVWNALGLAGKAGDVAELVKKGVFHRHHVDPVQLEKELGDMLWYAAAICTALGLDLGEIMQANIERLNAGDPNRFSLEESQPSSSG